MFTEVTIRLEFQEYFRFVPFGGILLVSLSIFEPNLLSSVIYFLFNLCFLVTKEYVLV